jgi:hypothetical protein
MEKNQQVYAGKKRYFSAKDFALTLPGEQPGNESSLKREREPDLDKADKFAESLWTQDD